MPGNDFYGTPVRVRRIHGAKGRDRDALMRELFGELLGNGQREPTMYQTSSGLIVPEGVMMMPNPTDHMFVYLTTEEIFGPGQTLTMRAIINHIKKVSLESTVAWCAAWVAKLQHPARTQQEVTRTPPSERRSCAC